MNINLSMMITRRSDSMMPEAAVLHLIKTTSTMTFSLAKACKVKHVHNNKHYHKHNNKLNNSNSKPTRQKKMLRIKISSQIRFSASWKINCHKDSLTT